MPRPSRNNCKDCGEELTPINSVYNGFNRMSRCHDCLRSHRNIYRKEYGKRNQEKIRDYNFKAAYRISLEDYNKLFEFQQGGCAICRKPCKSGHKLSVDHNHKTGVVRGLLCKNCNLAIGHLNEDENLIWNLLDYLKRTTWRINDGTDRIDRTDQPAIN